MINKVKEKVRKLNDTVAIKVTVIMSSMWCVWVFLLWSLLPVFDKTLETVVFYVSGGVIQLIALPLIMVGQSLLNASSEERAVNDHLVLLEEFKEIKELTTQHKEELKKLNTIITNQNKLIKILNSKK